MEGSRNSDAALRFMSSVHRVWRTVMETFADTAIFNTVVISALANSCSTTIIYSFTSNSLNEQRRKSSCIIPITPP
jgi:hypothetical protein